jgi:hypothetical protein
MTDERGRGFSKEEMERIVRELEEADRRSAGTRKRVNPKWAEPLIVDEPGRRRPRSPRPPARRRKESSEEDPG